MIDEKDLDGFVGVQYIPGEDEEKDKQMIKWIREVLELDKLNYDDIVDNLKNKYRKRGRP